MIDKHAKIKEVRKKIRITQLNRLKTEEKVRIHMPQVRLKCNEKSYTRDLLAAKKFYMDKQTCE